MSSFLERPSVINRWLQENKACAKIPAVLCQLLSITPLPPQPIADRLNSLDQQLKKNSLSSFCSIDELLFSLLALVSLGKKGCIQGKIGEVQTTGKWHEPGAALAFH